MLGAEFEAGGRVGGHKNRFAARNLHDIGEADPVRGRDEDFVAFLDECHDGVVDGMLAAHADDAFTRLMGTAELLCVPAADRLAQRCDARRRGVFRAVTL